MTEDGKMVQRLSEVFAEELCTEVTLGELEQIVELNANEDNDSICHSHDFCDANEVMHEAFLRVVGREPYSDDDLSETERADLVRFLTDPTWRGPLNTKAERDNVLWGEAWTKAKKADFYAPGSRTLRRLCLEAINGLHSRALIDGTENTDQIYDMLMNDGWHHETMLEVYPETHNLDGDDYGDALDGFDGEAIAIVEWLGRWNRGLIL